MAAAMTDGTVLFVNGDLTLAASEVRALSKRILVTAPRARIFCSPSPSTST
jgi:hypothetical protein